MTEKSQSESNRKSVFTEKEKFLLRISSVTDLTVPPVILEQLFPILNDGRLPDDFGCSNLMHDPSIVIYFLKQLYDNEENRETLFSGMDDIFNHLGKDEMYALLSEMSPMSTFDDVNIEEWKHN